jgi:hypothetical protein
MTGSTKQSSLMNKEAGLLRRFAPRNDDLEAVLQINQPDG